MQTLYILKNCLKSYRALMLLYQNPDISNNIIIVDSFYYKVLKMDDRVTKFPFIINTAPTNTGLIPKIAQVLPLELFIDLTGETTVPKKIKRPKRAYIENVPNRELSYNRLHRRKNINYPNERRTIKPIKPIKPIKGVPIIRKTPDGGVDIVLN